MLTITNTKTGRKEPFIPLSPKKVLMYVCGITPYDYAHIGHGRVYVTFDVLYRLLQFLGFEVEYCRNFTDIDDKLLNKAEKEFGERSRYKEIAERYIQAYHRDIDALYCLPPTYEPRVTENIQDIITFVASLVNNGSAYVSNGDIFFSVQAHAAYPQLSKHKLSDLRAGARVEVSEKKRDPLDFALWKADEASFLWESPWGMGRPGWHIECSALALRYLGEQLDIHGGGMDLIFPHHDNEIAQTEALTGKPFARYWMHNAFVRANEEKMSKSLGNFVTLQDLLKEFDPQVLRYYYLTYHYRTPLDFSLDEVRAAQKSYQRLVSFFNQTTSRKTFSYEALRAEPTIATLLSYLEDDLNTAGFIGMVFSLMHELDAVSQQTLMIKQLFQIILGLSLEPIREQKVVITPEIQKLLEEREQARKEKDWARADVLRDRLKELGIELHDQKMQK